MKSNNIKYNIFIWKKYKEWEYVANKTAALSLPQAINLHFGETELLFVQYASGQTHLSPTGTVAPMFW